MPLGFLETVTCATPSATQPRTLRHITPVAAEDEPYSGIPRFAELDGMTRKDVMTRRQIKVLLLQAATAMMGDYRSYNTQFANHARPKWHRGVIIPRKRQSGEL